METGSIHEIHCPHRSNLYHSDESQYFTARQTIENLEQRRQNIRNHLIVDAMVMQENDSSTLTQLTEENDIA